ncbi:type II toxin-antitoxin system ParD family antitoxin [Neorhizobium galegae]|uniref:type II toxin-antitoxin system ParD family antitoxin n=1 Tax=Neorhizobium galegae TaxID=399 RepID=UPI0021082FCB|nr:type II toxin-antitoxin system ParD family antitoxin [Neorhizobium galegae]MCQ1833696.1 type II toxin-antitoxin system ParD family antitoxin [Neorhizobium galegae]UIY30504.1 type II toxin-antitoxin system ParD family antitoxin [Neorhizobium galegae]
MAEIHLSDEDRDFIEEQVKAGIYKDADEVVAARLRQLREETEALKQMIQEGLDDVEAGRVHSYASAEELSNDIKRMADEKRMGTGY